MPAQSEARQEAMHSLLTQAGFLQAVLQPLASDASFRRYIRVQGGAMLMDAPPEKEDVRPFVHIAQHLYGYGYSVPSVLAVDEAQGYVLLEDLGDDSYSRILRRTAEPELQHKEQQLYGAAVDVLVDWYRRAHAQVDFLSCDIPVYDDDVLMREVRLFSDWFLPQVLGKEKAQEAAPSYLALWEKLLKDTPLARQYFVHRDYHADNLMWLPDRRGVQQVGLLDFQDALRGDAAYDLVSLLEDARRDVSPALAQEMIAHFVRSTGEDKERFALAYALLGAQRNCKIIGIFTRLAARDSKVHYLGMLGRVWRHLEHDLQHPVLRPLADWMNMHVPGHNRRAITIRFNASALGLAA